MNSNQKQHKVFYGWWIVGACFLITLYTGGVVYFGFTAVFEPIAEKFGWSYAQISIAASLRGLEIGLLAPLVGFLADRWGPRRLVFGGSILVSLGLLVLGRVSSLSTFYGAFAVISVGMSACLGTVLITAVANWFRKKAAIATGIVVSGFGLGGLLVPVVTRLIDTLEWQTAMFTLSLGMLGIALPLSLLIRHKPEQHGYLPDGEISSTVETGQLGTSAQSVEISIPARQALRSRAFWHMALAATCHAFVVGAVITHIMPYLSSIGISRSTSSAVALVLPVVSIGGRLGIGWLTGRLERRRVYALGFTLMTIGMLFFGYVTGQWMWLLVPFIIIFSLGWGSNVTMRMTLLRQYFGRSSFGTILGFSSGIMMVGHVTGTPLAGWVFDTWGSYRGIWLGYAVLALTGLILVLTIPSLDGTVQSVNKPGAQETAE